MASPEIAVALYVTSKDIAELMAGLKARQRVDETSTYLSEQLARAQAMIELEEQRRVVAQESAKAAEARGISHILRG